jgi:hypothetical protein
MDGFEGVGKIAQMKDGRGLAEGERRRENGEDGERARA